MFRNVEERKTDVEKDEGGDEGVVDEEEDEDKQAQDNDDTKNERRLEKGRGRQ